MILSYNNIDKNNSDTCTNIMIMNTNKKWKIKQNYSKGFLWIQKLNLHQSWKNYPTLKKRVVIDDRYFTRKLCDDTNFVQGICKFML